MIFKLKKNPFIAVLVALMLYQTVSWAENPGIEIKLKFQNNEKLEYIDYSKQISLLVTVSNKNDGPILVNRGFKGRDFYRNIKIVDPSGRLLISKRPDSPREHSRTDQLPHLYPLPYVLPKNDPSAIPIRVIPCEKLSVGDFDPDPKQKNLRDYFHPGFPELPGYYSAQVQVSAMIFNEGTCDADHPSWTGLIKSNILSFYAKGRTVIEVHPSVWKLSWTSMSSPPEIKIIVYCQEGKKPVDYDLRNIYLNYRTRLEFKPEGSKFIITKSYPKGGECIKSMGDLTTPGKYWITVTGRLKNGRLFGGSEKITITK